MDSPFQSGGDVYTFSPVKVGQTLSVRSENISSLVHIKLGTEPAIDDADFYLEGGDALDIKFEYEEQLTSVNIMSIVNNPKIYWIIR